MVCDMKEIQIRKNDAGQRLDRFVGKAPHLLAGARPVGAVLTVTQVDERLSGERTPHLAPDGQPAQPRIENTDGCII